MKNPFTKARLLVWLVLVVVFGGSLLAAYVVITILPFAYQPHRLYSIPSDVSNPSNSTMGGEAFFREDFPVDVFFGPGPGATDVSRDTVIYVFQPRPVHIDLHLTPETSISQVVNEFSPPASRQTTLYPAELLLPNTRYNVSGSIMGLSAWWTFTTSSEPAQPRTENLLSPYALWAAITVATLTTVIVSLAIRHKRASKKL